MGRRDRERRQRVIDCTESPHHLKGRSLDNLTCDICSVDVDALTGVNYLGKQGESWLCKECVSTKTDQVSWLTGLDDEQIAAWAAQLGPKNIDDDGK